MRTAPSKCMFCLDTKGPFQRVEHPISESLGNDDITLPAGFVCDVCNQYFGSKVEHIAVNAPPFGFERVGAAIKTKKGKLAKFEQQDRIKMVSTGYKDKMVIVSDQEYFSENYDPNNLQLTIHSHARDFLYITRLLLKMGLELLVAANTPYDPYASVFNAARQLARYAAKGKFWELGYAVYPWREDLIISVRSDLEGPIVKHQLYQYDMGIRPNGDVMFCFVYRTHIFSCNLSTPSIIDYINGFNFLNECGMQRIIVKS